MKSRGHVFSATVLFSLISPAPPLILLALLTCLIPASSFAQTEIMAGTYDKIIVVIGENLGYEPLWTHRTRSTARL